MLFNSVHFLFIFLTITYFVFWRLRNKNHRYVWLTITGYVFYGTWNYKFCALMAFSTVVSFTAGLAMLRVEPRWRKLCLVLPITVDLLLLGFFKYFNFGLLTVARVVAWLHHPMQLHPLDIILPVGISFYTFHTITYIVDSYRGVITPTRNFFEFSCYVSLFPQLLAGPIVRFRQIEQDLENINHPNKAEWLQAGWSYLVLGRIKKAIMADSTPA